MLAVAVLVLIWLLVVLSESLVGRLTLGVFFVGAVTVKFLPYWLSRRRHRLQALGLQALVIDDVDKMSGLDFERYVACLLEHQGFKTRVTKSSGDFGVDVVARKDGVGYTVQCKRLNNVVSRIAVSDAVAGKHHYKCSEAMVVTNRYFTKGAQIFAKSNNCVLVDRDELAMWILAFKNQRPVKQSLATKILKTTRRWSHH